MLNPWYGLIMSTAFLAGMLAQVYVPSPDWIIYFAECSVFAAWIVIDAINRRAGTMSTLAHAAAAAVLAPIAIPRWFACRPLKPGEWRKGGPDTNYFLAFGVMTIVFTGVSAACNFQTYGAQHGFEIIINSGFAVAGVALLMSLICRQERVFEKGPAVPVPTRTDEGE